MSGVCKKVIVNAPANVMWNVITDIEKYPEFVREVKSVVIEKRDGPMMVATYKVELLKTIRYTVELVEEEKYKKFSWSLVRGQMMSRNDGSWELTELGPYKCEATYRIDIKIGMLVPSSITDILTEVSLPNVLDVFKKRAESMVAK